MSPYEKVPSKPQSPVAFTAGDEEASVGTQGWYLKSKVYTLPEHTWDSISEKRQTRKSDLKNLAIAGFVATALALLSIWGAMFFHGLVNQYYSRLDTELVNVYNDVELASRCFQFGFIGIPCSDEPEQASAVEDTSECVGSCREFCCSIQTKCLRFGSFVLDALRACKVNGSSCESTEELLNVLKTAETGYWVEKVSEGHLFNLHSVIDFSEFLRLIFFLLAVYFTVSCYMVFVNYKVQQARHQLLCKQEDEGSEKSLAYWRKS